MFSSPHKQLSNGSEVPHPPSREISRALNDQRRLRSRRWHAYDRVCAPPTTILSAASCTHLPSPHRSRLALVDYRGQIVFSTYVLPTNPVTDYRTSQTGIQASDLQPGQFHAPVAVSRFTSNTALQIMRCLGKMSSNVLRHPFEIRSSSATPYGKTCLVSILDSSLPRCGIYIDILAPLRQS